MNIVWNTDLLITAMNKIRAVFHLPEAKQLLTPYWRAKNEQSEIASTGFCYIATEALFHLIGGVDSKYKPCYFKENGESHWWLINEKNRILDPTFDQYGLETPPYHLGKRAGFLNGYSKPSKRAAKILLLVSS